MLNELKKVHNLKNGIESLNESGMTKLEEPGWKVYRRLFNDLNAMLEFLIKNQKELDKKFSGYRHGKASEYINAIRDLRKLQNDYWNVVQSINDKNA